MESFRQDLFIDMFGDRFIFKNDQIMFSPRFTFIPKTGVGLPKAGASFYCGGRIWGLEIQDAYVESDNNVCL